MAPPVVFCPFVHLSVAMTTITLIHTSDAHVPTFKALAERIAPQADLVQLVREDWLRSAQKHGLRTGLRDEIATAINAAEGTVICTCTTIGEAATQAGAIRIDAPMMAEAAAIGGPVLLVYALDSTAQPSLQALEAALAAANTPAEVAPLNLSEFWPLFEAGQFQAFAACMAGGVRDALEQRDFACVILAQASMAQAAPLLADLKTPVLTSPEAALRAAIKG